MQSSDPKDFIRYLNWLIAICLISAALLAVHSYKITKEFTALDGTVVSIDKKRSSGKTNTIVWRPVVRYQIDNDPVQTYRPSVYSNTIDYEKGQSLRLYYNPKDHSDIRLGNNGALYMWSYALLWVVGLGLAARILLHFFGRMTSDTLDLNNSASMDEGNFKKYFFTKEQNWSVNLPQDINHLPPVQQKIVMLVVKIIFYVIFGIIIFAFLIFLLIGLFFYFN